ncbi:MAG: radical SAM protein [Rhodospirillales bacterium CG15_BIG_FIL_POST_REV_8_21_14_020_66_15]|nr:MAG: radical SAM protein [Rhodospirillales bacterium CG15_BIG_FIL_POST_REV_8_21_14_020_66_15]
MSQQAKSAAARKGRGAVTNRDGRFERFEHVAEDDGWAADGDLPPLRTRVLADTARTVIARNTSPDIPFDRSLNPYRGCEHGCVYCFARPSHAYLGLSPGLDFETKLFAKHDAADLLRKELAAKGYRCAPLQLGAVTDPYQPVERRLKITRRVLDVLAACDHPVSVTTKSDLVLRDVDILGPMAAKGLASVAVSVTTLDRGLARRLEPRAPTPAKRLAAIDGLARAGVPVTVLAAPMIPALNDAELEAIIAAAAHAGATAAGYVLLRLPGEVADLFREWLDAHFPDRADRVLGRLRASREGELYRAQWGTRHTGTGAEADLLAARFRAARKRAGMDAARSGGRPLRTDLFRPPVREQAQMSLF